MCITVYCSVLNSVIHYCIVLLYYLGIDWTLMRSNYWRDDDYITAAMDQTTELLLGNGSTASLYLSSTHHHQIYVAQVSKCSQDYPECVATRYVYSLSSPNYQRGVRNLLFLSLSSDCLCRLLAQSDVSLYQTSPLSVLHLIAITCQTIPASAKAYVWWDCS